MSKTFRYVAGAVGVITGAAVAGFGSGIGNAYGRHLMESGQLPLPGAPRVPRQIEGRRARFFSEGDRVRDTKGREGTITAPTWENASYVLWEGNKRPSIVRHANLAEESWRSGSGQWSPRGRRAKAPGRLWKRVQGVRIYRDVDWDQYVVAPDLDDEMGFYYTDDREDAVLTARQIAQDEPWSVKP